MIRKDLELEGKRLLENDTEATQSRKYISEDRALSESEVRLIGMMGSGNIFGKLNFLQYLIFLLAILSLLLLLRLVFVLRGRVILPINQLVEATKQIGAGNWEECVKMDAPVRELKALQMQIRPHFFLNALTTIHSMTFKNKNEEIRTFTEALSEYMRYTIRDGISTVTVREETDQVRKYVEMQSIRFPESMKHCKPK